MSSTLRKSTSPTASSIRTPNKPEKGGEYKSYYVEQDHEGIVSVELWDEVQKALAEQRNVFANKNSHYLRGKVVCANCGEYFMRATRKKKTGKYKKWICKGHLASSGCKNQLMWEEDLLAHIEKKLGDSDKYIVARICALGDSAYAKAHVNEAGLLRRSDKWLWYDYGSRCWLDLTKPLTQSYVKQVCKDLTDLGVDEIVLERFGWPAVGNMGAMVVPEGTDKPAVISAFLKELRETLPKTTAVSVLIGTNAPENSGLTPAVLAEFDRVYADPENVDVEALAATMPADFKREAQLVQLVTAAQLAQMNQTTPYTGSYVLVNG